MLATWDANWHYYITLTLVAYCRAGDAFAGVASGRAAFSSFTIHCNGLFGEPRGTFLLFAQRLRRRGYQKEGRWRAAPQDGTGRMKDRLLKNDDKRRNGQWDRQKDAGNKQRRVVAWWRLMARRMPHYLRMQTAGDTAKSAGIDLLLRRL